MLLHTMIDLIAMFFVIWSFIALIWSGTNRNGSVCILILSSGLVGAAYLFIDLFILPGLLNTPSGLDELGVGLLAFLAFAVYLISFIINSVKLTKYIAQTVTAQEKLRNRLVLSGMIVIPVVIILLGTIRDYHRIRNSDAIVIIYSRRDTNRLLDNEKFGYVISGDTVHRFELMLTGGIQDIIDEEMIPCEI